MSVRATVFFAVLMLVGIGAGCNMTDSAAALSEDQEAQTDILNRAQQVEPAYRAKNFLGREAMNEWARRMDSPDKLWYIYLRANNGALIGYHVCRTPPLSFGVSMTNPKQIIRGSTSESRRVLPAPGLDGLYYGAADPELYFCFDAETDTMIHFRIGNSTYYDAPLDGLEDAPRLTVKVENGD